ncbi:MAG TPA: hypothetical protein VMG31_08280 [Verrucomicrobiae bacterium]|nr:hypothetical protein [Verrucomicrobiae bacterium]
MPHAAVADDSLPLTAPGRHYNRDMKLGILAVLLLCPLALAQKPVDLASDPHYHLLLDNDTVRVYAMTLRPDDSAFVRMEHSFMTVTLQDGEIILWDAGKSPIQHFQMHKGETSFVCLTPEQQSKGVAGGFRNDRPQEYRNITVEFKDRLLGWAMLTGGTISPPASMYLGGALVADVLLQPSDSFPAPDKPGPELVIPVSPVDLKNGSGLRVRSSPGEVSWIPADHASSLANAARDPARFIIVEFQPDNP